MTVRDVPDTREREQLINQLNDSAVLAIAALRRGRRARVAGPSEAFDALVIEELPTEFGGYGDPLGVADLMLTLDDWGCVEVEREAAEAVAARFATAGLRARFYGSVYYQLRSPTGHRSDPAVRLLEPDDQELITSAVPELGLRATFDVQHDLLAAAIVDDQLVACASCTARSSAYADIAVTTFEPFRGRGLATAAAALVAEHLQRAGYTPIWSTGDDNHASQRIARKLGFTVVTRRTYVIAVRA